MDLLAHAMYGATLCSRTGLGGGVKLKSPAGNRPQSWAGDWTVWAAVFFSLLPDVVSLWPPFIFFWLQGSPGNFFREISGHHLVCYRYMHSLLVALAVAGICWLIWQPLFVPALAWPVHVCMDAITHGLGKFQTTLFYPLSSWAVDGIRWWEHPEAVLSYWLLLPGFWLGLRVLRQHGLFKAAEAGSHRSSPGANLTDHGARLDF